MQFEHPRPRTSVGESALFGRGASPPRRGVDDGVPGADRTAGGAPHVQEVQFESAGQLPAGEDSAHAVAVAVEAGREDGDAELAREHGHHRPGHPALGGESDAIDPVAGSVVHPAGGHDTENALGQHGVGSDVPGARIGAVVGERRGHRGDVPAGDGQRALPEVQVDGRVGIGFDHAERAQHVPDRAVPVPGGGFRGVHGGVQLEFTPGEPGEGSADALELVVGGVARDERRGGDGAGVDHRVARPLGDRVEADLVERLARRLDVDLRRDRLLTAVGQRQGVGERLGHRLDGEGHSRVAHLVHVSVRGGEADAEALGFRGGELRDVVGDGAGGVLGAERVDVLEDVLHDVGHRLRCLVPSVPVWPVVR